MAISNREWILGETIKSIENTLTEEYYAEAADVFKILIENSNSGFTSEEIANQVLGDVLLETGYIGPDGETHRESNYEEIHEFRVTIERLLSEFVDAGFVETRDIKTADGVETYYRFHAPGWEGVNIDGTTV